MSYQAFEGDVTALVSAITRRLASPLAAAPPVREVDAVVSAIAQRLAPSRYTTQALASAILYRVASPARSAVTPTIRYSEIDTENLASEVIRRLGDLESASSPKQVVDSLASAVAGQLRQPIITMQAGALEQLVSKVASAINRHFIPPPHGSGPLPSADRVDASQALRAEDRRTRKARKSRVKAKTSVSA